MAKATVKLTGDKQQLSQTLKSSEQELDQWSDEASAAAKEAADDAEKAAKKWGESFKATRESINKAGERLLWFGGAGAAAIAGLVYASEEQTKVTKQLERQVKNSGDVVGYTNEQLATMAERMGAVAGVSDKVVTATQTVIARFKNVRGENFRDATQAALDMAAALGGDASGMAEKLGEALNDPIKGLTMLEGEGVSFTKAQADMVAKMKESGDVLGAQGVILDAVKEKFGGAAAEFGGTYSGKIANFTDKLVDIAERGGAALIPWLDSLSPVLDNVIGLLEVFGQGWENTGEQIEQSTTMTKSVIDEWFDYIVGGLGAIGQMIGFFFTNFGDLGVRELKRAQLFFVGVGEEAKHLFGTVLPDFLGWLQRNWPEVFEDIANFTKTVFGNILDNASGFMKALMDLLQGKGFNFEFTALTDGFETSLKELPVIAKRELTATEQQIAKDIDTLDKELEQKWNDALLSVDKGMRQAMRNSTKTAVDEGAPAMPSDKPLEVFNETPATTAAIEARATRAKTEVEQRKREDTKESSGGKTGAAEGLEALRARISAAAAGTPEDKRHKENIDKLDKLIASVDQVAAEVREASPEDMLDAAINSQKIAVEDLEAAVAGGDTGANAALQEALGGLGMLKGQQEALKNQRQTIDDLRKAFMGGDVGAGAALQEALEGLGTITASIPQVLTEAQRVTIEKASREAGGINSSDKETARLLTELVKMNAELLNETKNFAGTQRETRDATKAVVGKLPQPAVLG